MRNRLLSCLAAMLLTSSALGQNNVPESADLPLNRAVLYSSGVGYFEHAGSISDQATVQLLFRTEQINDVLKSLLVLDPKGSPAAVTYASADPVERALRSFSIDLNPSALHEILAQARGAGVRVSAPDPMEGKIISVEARLEAAGEAPVPVERYWLNLLTEQGIVSIPFTSMQNLTFTDPKWQGELSKALELLLAARDRDARPVTIHFAGQGTRAVRVGYLVETPIWKTSYRLDLSGEKPYLQGWAIVENTSNADWTNVQLSLVSGRPISFVQDLYTPLYFKRPVVTPPSYASLQPRLYEEGLPAVAASPPMPNLAADGVVGQSMEMMDKAGGAMALRESRRAVAAPAELAMVNLSPTAAAATATRVGQMFQFTLDHPIDIPRRQSAMLAILSQDISAEKVSIYNAAVLDKHPLHGAYLMNSTGTALMAGPITVLDGGAYAGDAQLDDMAVSEKRLLSYAVDLDMTVDPSAQTSSRISAAQIVRGVLQLTRLTEHTQTYRVLNKSDTARTLLIEHPVMPQARLIEPGNVEEKTDELYRFRLTVKPKETTEFPVRQQETDSQAIVLLNQPLNTLMVYVRQGEIHPSVRDALSKAMAMKQELSKLQEAKAQLTRQIQQITNDQQRLRENLKTVEAGSNLGKRYLAKLNEQEDQLDQAQAQADDLDKQIQEQQNKLADYLGNLTINPAPGR
ncbi:MAG: DUF4139 domain-containing protein [Phycisphaeraceae bacterium]|nr:DUF4139 domain-containing protein [Phycisphaeraceae bacterium]